MRRSTRSLGNSFPPEYESMYQESLNGHTDRPWRRMEFMREVSKKVALYRQTIQVEDSRSHQIDNDDDSKMDLDSPSTSCDEAEEFSSDDDDDRMRLSSDDEASSSSDEDTLMEEKKSFRNRSDGGFHGGNTRCPTNEEMGVVMKNVLGTFPKKDSIHSELKSHAKRDIFVTICRFFQTHSLKLLDSFVHSSLASQTGQRKRLMLPGRGLPECIEVPHRTSVHKQPYKFVKFSKDVKKRNTSVYMCKYSGIKVVLKMRFLDKWTLVDLEDRIAALNHIKAKYSTSNLQHVYHVFANAELEDLDMSKRTMRSGNNGASRARSRGFGSSRKGGKGEKEYVPSEDLRKYLKRKRVYFVLMKYQGVSLLGFKKKVLMNRDVCDPHKVLILKKLMKNLVDLLVLFEENQAYLCDLELRNFGTACSLKPQIFDEEMMKFERDAKMRLKKIINVFDVVKMALCEEFFHVLFSFLNIQRKRLNDEIIAIRKQ